MQGTAHDAVTPTAHQGGPLKDLLEQASPRSRVHASLGQTPSRSRGCAYLEQAPPRSRVCSALDGVCLARGHSARTRQPPYAGI
jgi:hypothetical protein